MKVFILWRHILSSILVLQRSLIAGQPKWQETPMNTTQIQGGDVHLNCKLENMGSVLPMWIRINGKGSLKQIALGKTVYNDCCEVTGNHGQGEYSLLIKKVNVSEHEGIWQCTHIEADPQNVQARITVIVPVSSVKITKNADYLYTCEAIKGKPPASFLWTINDSIYKDEGRVTQKYQHGISDSVSFHFVNNTAVIYGSNLTCIAVQPLLEDIGPSHTVTVYFNITVPDSDHNGGSSTLVIVLSIIPLVVAAIVAFFVIYKCRERRKERATQEFHRERKREKNPESPKDTLNRQKGVILQPKCRKGKESEQAASRDHSKNGESEADPMLTKESKL